MKLGNSNYVRISAITFSLFMANVVLICLSSPLSSTMQTTTDQSALVSLKYKITNDPYNIIMQNWTAASPFCSWVGVTCGKRHHRVSSLNISYMGLTGEIPPQLGNLSFLISLDFAGNNFFGLIPEDLSRLRRLRFVNISKNSFAGEVPSCFASLPRLEFLYVNNNSFTSLDSFFASFANNNESKLDILDVSFNSLRGTIPEAVGNLRNLKRLMMKGNQLSGFLPSSLANLTSLVYLNMDSNYIEGNLPEWIGNLRSLTYLNLQRNRLIGSIPSSIFNISTLENLGLFQNHLSGTLPNDMCLRLPLLRGLYLGKNEIHGETPTNISLCSKLQVLSVQSNNITGEIPPSIFNMSTLQILDLFQNHLSGTLPDDMCLHLPVLTELYLGSNEIHGEIPSNISLCSKLQVLSVRYNNIIGEIPNALGELEELETLDLSVNQLSGSVPINIYNITSLIEIDLAINTFSGDLPSKLGYFLPNLEGLYLGGNDFGGSFPNYILNCSKLTDLEISYNSFTGPIPSSIGEDLRFLRRLGLGPNGFTSNSELSFIDSLVNCRYLASLAVNENPLRGNIPASIGNLSSSLTEFYAYGCGIEGSIPSEIGNLTGLVTLNLGTNDLIGEIPSTLHNLQNLQILSLVGNRIEGLIPSGLCQLKSLGFIGLHVNKLTGPIPGCLGNISSLRKIYLDGNNLNSSIPSGLWNLGGLLELNISSNYLTGSLPSEIGNLKSATFIDLSKNQFLGDIPTTFGGLVQLDTLSLANNDFQGPIPESIGGMISLVSLDLSHNKLNGTIPKSLEALKSLEYFNVSFNELSGEIPTGGPFQNFTSQSFMFNDALCGPSRFNVLSCHESQQHRARKKKKKKKEILPPLLISIGIGALVFVVCLAYAVMRYRRKTSPPTDHADAPATGQPVRFSYYDLLHATENYSENNLLGKGSFGSVYKGVLRDGVALAVKVFHIQLERSLRSFEVECEALRNLRHRNLVRVLGSCTNQEFKAIVLEYMQNGSLEKCLYSEENQSLDIKQRLNIMIDVASALEYLHHGYSTPVVHCDLKPGNVLLDEHMVARISDFGITRYLNEGESMTHTRTLATLGYMAPEYGSEGIVSTRCDMYSYGIMLLETFTGKRPRDEMFSEDVTLRDWVNGSMPDEVIRVVDANLIARNNFDDNLLHCVVSILDLGLSCSAKSPSERTNMKEVAAQLKKIRRRLT